MLYRRLSKLLRERAKLDDVARTMVVASPTAAYETPPTRILLRLYHLVDDTAVTNHHESDAMALSFRDREIIRSVCPACRNDQYNHPRDFARYVPAPSDKCRLLGYVKYDGDGHSFRCPYWIPDSLGASVGKPGNSATAE